MIFTNKKLIGALVILVIVAAGLFFAAPRFISHNQSDTASQPAITQVATQTTNSVANQVAKIKLSDTKYWNYAYLISDDNLDAQAKVALSGFERTKEALSDGSIKITLKALSPAYRDQSYTLTAGQKLYFIETSMGDDPQFKEFNLGDDVAVKVDSDGYLVK